MLCGSADSIAVDVGDPRGARSPRAEMGHPECVPPQRQLTSTLQLAGLTTRVVGPSGASSTVVLLHGFGAPGDDLVDLAQMIDAPVRFVFPAAPLELGAEYGAGRAWWPLDLIRLEAELRRGNMRAFRAEVPEGLTEARDQLRQLLDHLTAGTDRLVIGGFSQGAMLALDAALHRPSPPAGVILMSGTITAEPVWQARLPSLAGVPVLQSHGRGDPLLPFALAELLRDQLRAAGAIVHWHAFPGGHEIPPAVITAAGQLLRTIAAGAVTG